MELAVRHCAGHGRDCHPWQRSAPSAIAYVAPRPLLNKEKPKQGDATTFLMEKQDKGSKLESLLYSKKSFAQRESQRVQTIDTRG